MKKLLIEWKHFEKGGKTCVRCNKTGINLKNAIKELKGQLKEAGVKAEIKETGLEEKQMESSNSLLINNVPIEDVLSGVLVLKNDCNSCGDLTGNSCSCRAIQINNYIHNEIPVSLIKKAILISINK